MDTNYIPLPAGTSLRSRYTIKRLLGKGGMGAVYLADDKNLHIQVAIKESFADTKEFQDAFKREAQILSKLTHRAFPRCFGAFSEGSRQFLVMEFIPGDNLSTLLKRNGRPFEYTRVLKWAEHLLDALVYIHTAQPPVIHRDIKPDNLKLTPQDQIILLDFGLAKGATGETSQSVPACTDKYAPLEQLTGQRTDARSDLYSLAVSIYHLLTGVIPPNALERYYATTSGQPDPLWPAIKINPQIPVEVSKALTQAMSLDSDGRFLSATAFLNALCNTSTNGGQTETHIPVPPRKIVIPVRNEPLDAASHNQPAASSFPVTENWPTELSTIVRPEPLPIPPSHPVQHFFGTIWGYRLGERIQINRCDHFALAPDGKTIVATHDFIKPLYGGFYFSEEEDKDSVTVYDLSTRQVKATLKIKSGAGSVAFSPDGKENSCDRRTSL